MGLSQQINILVVDDREENIISLQSIIEGEGREIYKAYSGNEALKLTLTVSFDLILCDVQMPGMDGFEMLELLMLDPSKRNIPFIFITAINKDEKYVHKGYAGGAVDYLFKPLNVDITRSKVDVFVELARQRKELDSKNIQLQSLHEQKNQFIGMLAHDLRNPISAIKYYCRFLLDDSMHTMGPEQLQIISSMDESSTFMLDLVNDLLDISHIESGKMSLNIEPVNVKPLVENIVNINSLLAKEKKIEIDFCCPGELPISLLDGPKLRQVLNNLISNAIKFSHSYTTVKVLAVSRGDRLYFEVEDQGQGIPKEELSSLFKPFQKTSVKSTSGEKSTGLGLLICSKIIESHGGKLEVESEVRKGSRFHFYIPLRKAVMPETEVQELTKNIQQENSIVVVADDNTINQVFLKRLLETVGYSVLLASNGLEVVNLVKENKIDLIFMDVEMPEMNGLQATRMILEEMGRKEIRIIGCTGHRDEREIEKCFDAGMICCIPKPVSRENLLITLESIKV